MNDLAAAAAVLAMSIDDNAREDEELGSTVVTVGDRQPVRSMLAWIGSRNRLPASVAARLPRCHRRPLGPALHITRRMCRCADLRRDGGRWW